MQPEDFWSDCFHTQWEDSLQIADCSGVGTDFVDFSFSFKTLDVIILNPVIGDIFFSSLCAAVRAIFSPSEV